MDGSALRSALASLDDCNSSLHWWLGFWTFLVALGVVLEVVFVVWEYREEMHDFSRGVIHPPERPNTVLFVLGFLGAALVAAGVSGELWEESKIATVETCIRKGNDAVSLLLSKEAGDAANSAKTARDEADTVKAETDELTTRLASAAKLLNTIEQDVRSQGPRWKLLEGGRDNFVKSLKPFAGQRVTVVECGIWGRVAPEPFKLEQDSINFLGKDGAGWAVETPGYAQWPECSAGGATSFGGNLVTFNSTATKAVKDSAKALSNALNELGISTIVMPTLTPIHDPLGFMGPDSPWGLASKDPTAVILLVGTNPVFDLAGWKKRKRSAKP
jgi:hypothetical protein